MTDRRRKLPSVNTLLERDVVRALLDSTPRAVVVSAVREVLMHARAGGPLPKNDAEWGEAVAAALENSQRSSLRAVINATGVVLHTNLGRAPLAAAAIHAVQLAAAGYTNLEYDVASGSRGSRYDHCVRLLRELTGAEDALVVNNNAAALVLVLNTLAADRSVVISRGELVEIGGSFRIPEIMERSGARLVEIGTTNRTHLSDYEAALEGSGDSADAVGSVGAVMKVHRSNFAMEGFVAEVTARDLAAFLAPRGIPLVYDLGSGLLIPLDELGLTGEPTAADAVRQGAGLVTMSGDKLLGGPQAGIIVGAGELLRRLRKNPLLRSLRVDKLTIAALEATLRLYRDPARARNDVPILEMLGRSPAALRERAQRVSAKLPGVTIVDSEASVGGGAFPNARIPSVALAIGRGATALEERLRLGDPAIVGRIAGGKLLLDLRTVQPNEDEVLARALRAALPS